jgi:endonuclease
MVNRPPVWQMIKEAVEQFGSGIIAYAQIKDYIWNKYGRDVNEGTINAQIIICTVNQPSRVHYPENQKPRISNSRYDLLFSVGRGQVVAYDPIQHGVWEIRQDEHGKLVIAQQDLGEITPTDSTSVEIEEIGKDTFSFPFESHLRDFIAKNLESMRVNGKRLRLFVDQYGRKGIEYPTDVGPIDVLALDEENVPVVFELKLNKSEDRTVGQILRYMGWVKQNLTTDGRVKGVIVGQGMNEKIKYAVSMTPEISLFEYEVSFTLKPASL